MKIGVPEWMLRVQERAIFHGQIRRRRIVKERVWTITVARLFRGGFLRAPGMSNRGAENPRL